VDSRYVVGMRVDATSYRDAARQVSEWTWETVGRYVCVANVHMAMAAHDDRGFRGLVNRSSLVTPDGMPLVWMLRCLGVPRQKRVYGPNLMLYVCETAERERIPIGLYGGTQSSLQELQRFLLQRFPRLQVTYAFAPPFRTLTEEEDVRVVKSIVESGAKILFVGLGCPKQERWMAAHKERLPLVQLGVGAAFDFHSGRIRQAPNWVQNMGLEWFFRLAMEPKRLFKRYAIQNPRFVVLAALQLAGLYALREE
jgi:N-acetylglucosaminyldiphosphoundecaprenol N-acetyl-beta-D-mannosaminyltransferase